MVRRPERPEKRDLKQEEEYKATARRFTGLVAERQLREAAELLSEDFVYHAPGFPDLAGRQEWFTLQSEFVANSPELQFNMDSQVAEGQQVVTRWNIRTVHERPFMGVPATGQRLEWESLQIDVMGKDGRIAEQWQFDDYLGIFRQLGVIPIALFQEKLEVPGGLGLREVPVGIST